MKPSRKYIWWALSLVCLTIALLTLRHRGSNPSASSAPQLAANLAAASATTTAAAAPETTIIPASTAPFALLTLNKDTNATVAGAALKREERLKYRLSNTPETIGQLTRNPRAVLLENALIDSGRPLDFTIPDSLKSQGDPGTYIVQARGVISDQFRERLLSAGATIVSYIPNNAYLVRMTAEQAGQLTRFAQAVLPYEPYYKLELTLLKRMLEGRVVHPSMNVLVFADARADTVASLDQLGVQVVSESPSPFGWQMVLENATDVAALARIPGIQRVESHTTRTLANDLTRARVRVSTNTVTTNNYLGLSGRNVTVDMNDSGVDGTHPDLVNRMFSLINPPNLLTDSNGHGTHVAGILAGDGNKSLTVTNARGSIMPGTNFQFRGKAPAANLFVMPINDAFSDFQLQSAAARTNALISNNSWGYGNQGYDIASASYDAAVRDALPERTGSQPVLFVFSAGNTGGGGDNGLNGSPESIESPSTAKNVITVGAIELPRSITNEVKKITATLTNTSTPWLGMTDSSNQVAGFSARGNVGIGIEGDFGRFKPDVVAPGTFVVSTRSQQWDQAAYYNPTNYAVTTYRNQTALTNGLNVFPPIFIPNNAVQLTIRITATEPAVSLPIYVRKNGVPTTTLFDVLRNDVVSLPPDAALATGTTYFFGVGDSTNIPVTFDLQTTLVTTNDRGNYFEVLSNLNNSIGSSPYYYRYETGTSMAAPVVSGVLALMQEFFQSKQLTNSPALMKALVINGARAVNSVYDFQVQNTINYQGWGLINLTNSLPAIFTNQPAIVGPPVGTSLPMLMFDQSPSRALATGESRTFNISVANAARSQPLRATLVWTDPPGNPAASIKLVNNLDLVITNFDDPSNPLVYFGNDIQAGQNANLEWDTNGLPNLDLVNNVESIILAPFLGTNYSVTVIARAVNVNAVTAHTNGIVQDYALVISSGNAQVATGLTLAQAAGIYSPNYTNLTVMTNQFDLVNSNIFGQVLGNQRVGANSPLIGTNGVPSTTANGVITLGETNQWHFYLITNTTTFTNALFATSLPLNLAPARMGVTNTLLPEEAVRVQADIDLYETTDPLLLTLDSNAVARANKSLGRGGFETIILSNAVQNQIYYIGVKSEDHQAAEYTLTSLFSLEPFNNGKNTFPAYPLPAVIPDGSPALPGAVAVTAYAAGNADTRVRRVTVTNVITHENFGDLIGTFSHDGAKPVVLNNHSFGNGNLTQLSVYEDTGGNSIPGSRHSDGPGSLGNFIGDAIGGQWSLVMVDNSLTHTGLVESLSIHIDPHVESGLPPGATNGVVLANCVTVAPGGLEYDFVSVPFNGSSVQICLSNAVPVQLYVRNGALPTTTVYDYTKAIPAGGACLTVSLADLPPLQPGTLFFAIGNSNAAAADVCYQATLSISLAAVVPINFSATGRSPVLDDAVSYSSIAITNDRAIASAAVGVVLNHPRVSDLALTLINPAGERYLLYENRGGLNATNLGHLDITTNFFGLAQAGNATANTNTISPVPTSGILVITYNFFQVPDSLDVFYDGVNIYSTGLINGAGTLTIPYGPGIGTSIDIVMNLGGNPQVTAWNYTPAVITQDFAYLTFTEDPTLTKTAIKFGVPPFDLVKQSTNYTLSSFEEAPSGEYLAPTNLFDVRGGWTMVTNDVVVGTNLLSMSSNQVSVVTDPSNAQSGSNYLALVNGTIARVVPTTPGKRYTFSYYYRGPGIAGWYRGEGNANDSSDPEVKGSNGSLIGRFNFPQGEVGQAFEFHGTNGLISLVQDPDQAFVQVREARPSIPGSTTPLDVGAGSGFTVEGWINPTNLSVRAPLVEWLAPVLTNGIDTNLVIVAGPFLNNGTGHYYYMLNYTNWTRSEIWATQLGGHLVTVEDANEENWIYNTFSSYGGTNRTLWTGLNDVTTPGTFEWVSGQTNVFYTNWVTGQPLHCTGTDNYVAIINPTNSQPGLWTLKEDNGRSFCPPATNRIHGIVEVEEIRTNGVQLWVSVTNSLLLGRGALYADIVDTNNISHVIFSAPGLIQSNVYQHVALTYNTNSGVANLYYNGTNVATTNLGVFRPKTGGDLLLGKDMSRFTNNMYLGKMDEMSVYRRFLSPTEIALIYRISSATNTLATNGNLGKFDSTVTPAFGLAEAQVSIGGSTNLIFGPNNSWQYRSFTFTATTSSIPVQITGLQPGILLDSFTVFEAAPGNLFYLPEESLADLVGQSSKGRWTLELNDLRAGATNFAAEVVSWQMQFIFQNLTPISTPLSPYALSTNTVPAGKTLYYTVSVPDWAIAATNILVSSTAPVDLLFNQTNPPSGAGPGDFILLNNVTSGVGVPDLVTNGVPPLLPGQTYYLGVRNQGANPATVVVRVDFNITTLSNGVPVFSLFKTNETERYFAFDVSSNAYQATFQLLRLSSNADLVVRRDIPLPTLFNSDFGSFNTGNADENIYVLTNSTPVPLSAGRWYLGVIKRDPGVVTYSVLAKELTSPISIIDLADNVPFNFTAGPGAALTNFFRFTVTNTPAAMHFELFNLSGNGDLTVQTNALPLSPPFKFSSQLPGQAAELIVIRTNSALPNLNAQWHLGVPNHETNLITYTILAVIETNSVFPAFPGAEGAGAGALGGRGGDVYHVYNLNDSGPGSLRDGVSQSLRTVVFDISGTINLLSPLKITVTNLTIAGQTAPGDGITIRGWVTSVQKTRDVVLRYLRFRTGDINCPNNQDDAFNFDFARDVIADHISTSWSIDEAFSATDSTNVTVQWSMIAESLNNSCHVKGLHGYGSLLRYGYGTLSYHHNLYADNFSRNPRLGDNLSLDFVNNVVYNWGLLPGYSGDDSLDNPQGFTNRLNYVENYLITGNGFIGSSTVLTNIAFSGGSTNTWIYQTNNVMDANRNGILDGARIGWRMFTNEYTPTNRAFALPPIATDEAFLAYERVLAFVGTGMDKRDAVDRRIVGNVRTQTGNIIDSQTQVGGWPVLNSTPPFLDTDQDGIPDFWETTFGQSVTNANNNLDRDGDGYSDLEEYINWLAAPHALTITNVSVGVDLVQLFGKTGNLSFSVTNGVNGLVYLTNVFGGFTNAGPYSNSIAIFTPTNSTLGGTNYYGYAAFDVFTTNNDTVAHFGPVTVSVAVSAVPILYAANTNPPPVLSTNLPNVAINEGTLLTVTNTATSVNTNLILSYVVSLIIDTNAMITNGWPLTFATTVPSPIINSNGIITWTPSEAQGPGVYTITTVVTDNGIPPKTATNSFSVTVNEVNLAPFWPPNVPSQTNYIVAATTTLTVVNTALDSDIPPNPLTYTLTVSPPVGNAVISTNGIITWTPTIAQAPGVYTFMTIVTDTNQFAVNAKSLSATNFFTVTVTPVGPPFAFTHLATLITGGSARLNGMATANGLPATAWFQWGTNTLYGNQTPAVNAGSSFNVLYTTNLIGGLLTNVPYHFRLVVTNALGAAYGFDQILNEANVVVWGANYIGQGNVRAGLSNVVAIAGAYDHSLALKHNGTVAAWGDDTFGQSTVPPGLNNLVGVAGGQYYSLALRSNGTVTNWGVNILGALAVPPGLNNVVTIAGGQFASLALRNSGLVTAWGAGFFGLNVVPPTLINVVSVAGGSYHNLAIRNDGTVAAWGDNSSGQTNLPPGLTNVVAIAAGGFHSLALKGDGTVVAWGDNSSGQTNVIPGLTNVVAIAAGGFHSLALKSDGTVVSWGDNGSGQRNSPVGLGQVAAISSGYFHSLALTPQVFTSTNPVIFDLTNGVPRTNSFQGLGLVFYRVSVPTNVDFTTNTLLFSQSGPLNIWFTTNTPPSITNGNDRMLLGGVTNGFAILSTNSAPTNIVPGRVYYLGVENTNNFSVNYGIQVDFHFFSVIAPPPTNAPVIFSIVYTNIAGTNGFLLTWFAPSNQLFQVQWSTNLAPPSWNTFSNIVSYNTNVFTSPTNTQFNFFDDGTQTGGFGPIRFYRLVLLPAVIAPPPVLTNGVPLTNSIAAGDTNYFRVNVPVNADFATNRLLFATNSPLNVWFTTNSPPTLAAPNDSLLLGGVTSGVSVLGTNSSPRLVPGSFYYLGVHNTNSVAVTYAIEVDFHLVTNAPPVIMLSSIIATNIGGTNGFLLSWFAPTNAVFQVQWSPTLVPANWQAFSNNITYTGPLTSSNGLFTFFDNGVQFPFGPGRYYRLMQLGGNLAPVLPPGGQVYFLNPLTSLNVTNTGTDPDLPPNILTYTLSSTVTGTTNLPTISTNTGVISWTPSLARAGTSNVLTTVVTDNGVPSLSATNSFVVIVNPVPVINSVILNPNGFFQLDWFAPTNNYFLVLSATNLSQPVVWATNGGFVYPFASNYFRFIDSNSMGGFKFFRLLMFP